MKVAWTPKAVYDVAFIISTIALDNKTAALKLQTRIMTVVENKIASVPHIGRQGRVVGTREFVVHSSYIIVYRISQHQIEILTVRHTARLWPEGF